MKELTTPAQVITEALHPLAHIALWRVRHNTHGGQNPPTKQPGISIVAQKFFNTLSADNQNEFRRYRQQYRPHIYPFTWIRAMELDPTTHPLTALPVRVMDNSIIVPLTHLSHIATVATALDNCAAGMAPYYLSPNHHLVAILNKKALCQDTLPLTPGHAAEQLLTWAARESFTKKQHLSLALLEQHFIHNLLTPISHLRQGNLKISRHSPSDKDLDQYTIQLLQKNRAYPSPTGIRHLLRETSLPPLPTSSGFDITDPRQVAIYISAIALMMGKPFVKNKNKPDAFYSQTGIHELAEQHLAAGRS